MKEVCQNCEYFMRVNTEPTTSVWGDCRKPVSGLEQASGGKKVVFKWNDATCSDFKHMQEAEKTGRCI